MTIGAEALPMVSNYALRKPPGLFESRGDLRRMHLTSQPDPENLTRIWLLSWQLVNPDVVKAIWSHYEQHGLGTFQWKVPLTGSPAEYSTDRHFRWATPPNVQWSSPRSASVTGELEEVLAYKPT
tara:strand:+ start:1254 stop:1628 length:375 start_codon:yes stop_codon:yes gene_type:complete